MTFLQDSLCFPSQRGGVKEAAGGLQGRVWTAAAETPNTEVPVFAVNKGPNMLGVAGKNVWFNAACASKQLCWHQSILHLQTWEQVH